MRYFLQRIGQFVIVFVIVTFGVMVLMRLGLDQPGDPARTMLGGAASDELIAETTARYHLDSNYLVQYGYWLKGVASGDFGFSAANSVPVSTLLRARAPSTLVLGIYAVVLAVAIAVPVGVYQASRRDAWFDRSANLTSFVLVSLPAIVLAPILQFVFVSRLGWFPRISDKIYLWDDPVEHVRNFFLPVIVVALPVSAVLTRLLRADMVLTLQSDFVTLARAKGVTARRILWVHALRNSMLSLTTSIGLQIGALIGGAIVAEQYFQIKGMGTMLVTAILGRDLFTVQGTAAVLVIAVVSVNLLIDLLYGVIDPRIRQVRALG